MMLVNIQTYGDFDMAQTCLIMVAPELMGKATVTTIVKVAQCLNSKTNDIDVVVKELKKLGFTTCESIDLTIGGEL